MKFEGQEIDRVSTEMICDGTEIDRYPAAVTKTLTENNLDWTEMSCVGTEIDCAGSEIDCVSTEIDFVGTEMTSIDKEIDFASSPSTSC